MKRSATSSTRTIDCARRRAKDLFKWGERHDRIAKVLVADALANGCSPDKIRSIANGMLRELTNTTFVPKEKPAPRAKRSGQSKMRPAKAKPVPPPWCQEKPLPARAEALLQALKAAGVEGLAKFDGVLSFALAKAASNRGIEVLVSLTMRGVVVEADERVYLKQFAPGAEAETPPEGEPQPAAAGNPIPPILAKLQAAGGNGMSPYELMLIVGFDPASLTAALAPLTEAGSVIEREGRYYYRMSEAEYDRARDRIRADYGR
jgi:hypothetical protein